MVKLSIITVTHNRRALLERKLETLKVQSLAPDLFEWIVCLNGDSEGAGDMLRASEAVFKVRTLEFSTQQGSSVARNACAKKASGEVLYFSDDDCLLEEGVLEAHLNTQQERPCVAIGGVQFKADSVNVWQPAKVNYWNTNGANTSVPKEAFDQLGGFDDRLQGYGGEDLLLGYGLKKRGLPFVSLPAAYVTHLGPDPMQGHDLEKVRSAGRNAAVIARYYPQLSFRLGVHPGFLTLKRALLPLLKPLFGSRVAGELTYSQAAWEEIRAWRERKA